ncbi:hypothetical protein BYT27DRAFT_6516868 [Phlegmacium glaucopus]|nr:hypothetical protein BYT27DRAFT_6516868 [Phlegmacium glaucopus]
MLMNRDDDVLVLRRWGPISETFFDVVEHAKMGALQDQRDSMRRTVEKSSRGYSISIPLGLSIRIRQPMVIYIYEQEVDCQGV